jgi:hypothetical protein
MVVTGVDIDGADDSSSAVLLSAWLKLQLQVPVRLTASGREIGTEGIYRVRLHSETGVAELHRPLFRIGTATPIGSAAPGSVASAPQPAGMLTEELRHQGADTLYGDLITQGLGQLIAADASGLTRRL